MSKEETMKNAREAIHDLDLDRATNIAQQALDERLNPLEIIEQGFMVAMHEVGDKFDRGELFLPHVMAAAEATKAAVAVLMLALEEEGKELESIGTVVLGTIEGDIHTLGKDIVAVMMRIAGFDVHDLGRDTPLS